MNWKQTLAGSIVKHEVPAAPAPSNDQELARALLSNYPNLPERDASFARSLLDGFGKYKSFTPKQRPHVERLAGLAPSAPSANADKPLAEKLGAVVHKLAGRDAEFGNSLLAGFARYGSFTDKQRPYVERLIASAPVEAPVDSLKEAIQARPIGKTYPNLCALVSLDKFARFTVGNFRASIKNDGSVIWLKWDGTIFGVIDTYTQAFRSAHKGLTVAQEDLAKHTLDEIEKDPKAAASADGILTGRCSCCSRPLTDPASIEIGIGPICIEKAGW